MKNTVARFLKARKDIYPYKKHPRKLFDEILEYLRFRKVEPYIPKDTRLLDISTGDGHFLHYLTRTYNFGNFHLLPRYFPDDFAEDITFDVITLLATIEHIPVDRLRNVVDACWKPLKPGGLVILTVPHPHIDKILDVLKKLRILEGFSMHQHHGFNPECLPTLFNGWKLVKKQRWKLGCNYLFIFENLTRNEWSEFILTIQTSLSLLDVLDQYHRCIGYRWLFTCLHRAPMLN